MACLAPLCCTSSCFNRKFRKTRATLEGFVLLPNRGCTSFILWASKLQTKISNEVAWTIGIHWTSVNTNTGMHFCKATKSQYACGFLPPKQKDLFGVQHFKMKMVCFLVEKLVVVPLGCTNMLETNNESPFPASMRICDH